MFDLRLLPIKAFRLIFQKFKPGLDEGIVIPSVIIQLLHVQMNYVGANVVQKVL